MTSWPHRGPRAARLILLFGTVVSPSLFGSAALTVTRADARSATISRGYTLKRARDFIEAYNRHDVAGVLGTLATANPRFKYHDCDFAFGNPTQLTTSGQVTAWLRARFAEGDRFTHVDVFNHNPSQNAVGGINASRVSDILWAHGSAPLEAGFKMVINDHGRFKRVEGQSFSCAQARFADRPSVTETRVLVTALVDAYNGHLVGRTLQLLGDKVTYRDCSYSSGRAMTAHGQRDVRMWLRSRFADGDHLKRVGAIYASARAARLTLRATGRDLTRPRSVQMRAQTDATGARLQKVTLSATGCS